MDFISTLVLASALNPVHVDHAMTQWPSHRLVHTYQARDYRRNVDCVMRNWGQPSVRYYDRRGRDAIDFRSLWQVYNWGQMVGPDPSDWAW